MLKYKIVQIVFMFINKLKYSWFLVAVNELYLLQEI